MSGRPPPVVGLGAIDGPSAGRQAEREAASRLAAAAARVVDFTGTRAGIGLSPPAFEETAA